MITLQDVIIMRISDFKRFFNLGEFWNKQEEFLRLFEFEIAKGVRERDYSLFVDNEEEKLLLMQLCNWLYDSNKELCNVKMEQEAIKIQKPTGEVQSYPLGRLQTYIEETKKQNKLTTKQIIGLTLLYLLLGANESASDIKIEYKLMLSNSSVSNLEEFNPCWEDRVLQATSTVVYPLKRCIFANMSSSKDIIIRCNSVKVVLKPKDCLVGLFCDSKCYKLLANEVSDADKRTTLKLTSNPNTSIPRLEIHSPEGIDTIDNVISIAIENGGFPVYATSDGGIHFDSSCFALGQRVKTFCKKESSKDLLAFVRDSYGNYIFYTSKEINY